MEDNLQYQLCLESDVGLVFCHTLLISSIIPSPHMMTFVKATELDGFCFLSKKVYQSKSCRTILALYKLNLARSRKGSDQCARSSQDGGR